MKIVFATNNPNKLREVQSLLPESIEIIGLKAIGCTEDVPETSDTIEGNAIQKAEYVSQKYKVACFADDTGLEVAALDGAPGVYSARYAGEAKDADKNMEKLLTELQGKDDRSAGFKTVIALRGLGADREFTGICEGEITTEKLGAEGFGYDPIFRPLGETRSFAQMPLAEKNAIGHRGKAVRCLIDFLTSRI